MLILFFYILTLRSFLGLGGFFGIPFCVFQFSPSLNFGAHLWPFFFPVFFFRKGETMGLRWGVDIAFSFLYICFSSFSAIFVKYTV